jgi:hypothetical protein
MKNNPIVLLLLFFSIFFTVSCKKEKTKTELLTDKTWLTTAITVEPGIATGGAPITDLLAQYEPCVRDNVFQFTLDKKYSVEEGTTKCNPSDAQSLETGTWFLDSSETLLTKVASDEKTILFKLMELNAKTLKMSEQRTLRDVKYTLSYVFTAQ